LLGFLLTVEMVRAMGSCVDGVWVSGLRWRRRIFVWEHVLVVDLLVVMDARILSVGADSWSWKFSANGMYSVLVGAGDSASALYGVLQSP
jgi:hypothetical protein